MNPLQPRNSSAQQSLFAPSGQQSLFAPSGQQSLFAASGQPSSSEQPNPSGQQSLFANFPPTVPSASIGQLYEEIEQRMVQATVKSLVEALKREGLVFATRPKSETKRRRRSKSEVVALPPPLEISPVVPCPDVALPPHVEVSAIVPPKAAQDAVGEEGDYVIFGKRMKRSCVVTPSEGMLYSNDRKPHVETDENIPEGTKFMLGRRMTKMERGNIAVMREVIGVKNRGYPAHITVYFGPVAGSEKYGHPKA